MPGASRTATLVAATPLTHDTSSYRFRVDGEPAGLSFRAGQFVSLRFGEKDDGTAILRSYSLASGPGGDGFDLVVKRVPGGAGSSWFAAARPGDRLPLTGPMGFFVLELSHPGDAVFAATGTGVAPMLPMIDELLARGGDGGHVHLLWGVREERDLFWARELAALAEQGAGRVSVTRFVSRPGPGWTGSTGRVTGSVLDLADSARAPTFYLCGNGAMIRELKAALVERGVDRRRRIRTEAFFE